jgi:nucleoside phosphorylase
MANIGIIVAMRTEIPYPLADTTGIYRSGANAIRVAVSGIGFRKARRTARRVCTGSLGFAPDLLINAGFCGAVQDGLPVGHLIIANCVAYRDQEIQLDNSLLEKLADLLPESEYHVGGIQTFNRPVLSRGGRSGDTLAVDMESFAIAQTAAECGVPTIILKAVSDIVPEHAGLIGLWSQARSLKSNAKKARARLSVIAQKIFEAPDLLDGTANLL